MAKLPDINYRGAGVTPVQSPGVAVQASNQRLALVNQALASAQQITDANSEYVFNKTKSAYADKMSQFRQETAGISSISRADAIAMEIDSVLGSKESYTYAEWYPIALERAMEKAKTEYGDKITNPKDRLRFDREVSAANNSMLESEIRSAAEQTRRDDKAMKVQDHAEALRNGWEDEAATIRADDVFTPAERKGLKSKANAEMFGVKANQTINFGTNADIDKFLEMMADPEKRASLNLTEATAQQYTTRAKSELYKREHRAETAANKLDRLQAKGQAERDKIGRDALENLVKAETAHIDVSAEQQNFVRAAVHGTPYEEIFTRYTDTQVYAQKPFDERMEELSSAKTFETADDYYSRNAKEQEIQEGFRDDGYQYALDNGYIAPEDFIPVDPNNPASMMAREEQREELMKFSGVPDLPWLTDGEARVYGDVIGNEGAPAEKWRMIQLFAGAEGVYDQFSKTGNSPYALLGTANDDKMAIKALTGQAEIDSGNAKPPTFSDHTTSTNAYLGGVYGPVDRATIVEVAQSLYVTDHPETNLDNPFNETDWVANLAEATGGVDVINGTKVQVPRGTLGETMQAFVDNFTPEQVGEFGGISNLTNEQAAERIKDAVWVSAGNDLYHIRFKGILLTTPDGEDFTVTYGKHQSQLTKAAVAGRRNQKGDVNILLEYRDEYREDFTR